MGRVPTLNTDDRLDDRFDHLEAEMDAQNSERISEFASLNRTLIQVGGGIIATIIGTALLALLTQL